MNYHSILLYSIKPPLSQVESTRNRNDKEKAKELFKELPPTLNTRMAKMIEKANPRKHKDDSATPTGSANSIPILRNSSILDEVLFEYL